MFVVGKTLGNGMYVIRGCCNSGSFFSITAERSTPIDVIYIFVSYCCDQSDANGPEELSFSLGFHQTPTCRPRRKQSRDNRLSVIGTAAFSPSCMKSGVFMWKLTSTYRPQLCGVWCICLLFTDAGTPLCLVSFLAIRATRCRHGWWRIHYPSTTQIHYFIFCQF